MGISRNHLGNLGLGSRTLQYNLRSLAPFAVKGSVEREKEKARRGEAAFYRLSVLVFINRCKLSKTLFVIGTSMHTRKTVAHWENDSTLGKREYKARKRAHTKKTRVHCMGKREHYSKTCTHQ